MTGPNGQFWQMARALYWTRLSPLTIAHDRLITCFRHKDILAENAKTRIKMAKAIAFSRQNRDFKIQRRGGNENVA